ncbi:hypothetical protein E2P81_ATG06218 [Venturia nashicola]|uniref:Uncharacterized protein n=1 Tax=Venturia nashicola TaxID=86259 RepID=A0A4Z1P2W0_9PEZI|nr:hypothetical protein E6O75_ATG06361 [Venturia nashicola]TLD27872.1 hypothetical protein E2P81_ATG06218 [Venturia nashicola]
MRITIITGLFLATGAFAADGDPWTQCWKPKPGDPAIYGMCYALDEHGKPKEGPRTPCYKDSPCDTQRNGCILNVRRADHNLWASCGGRPAA